MPYPPNPDDAVPRPTYLRNLTEALAFDPVTSNVYIRTDAQVDIGNANISIDDVGITSFGSIDINGDQLPITGNITIDPNQVVEVTQGTSPWEVSGTVNANITGNANVTLSSTASDAFGRLRTSNPYTLFETNSRYYNHGQFSTLETGSTAFFYDQSSSSYVMTVTYLEGDSIIRESKRVFSYQPGKSLLVMNTFCMNTPILNLRQRVGYFGEDNGIYFEANGTTLNMVIRSSSTGLLKEDIIPQSSWNGDQLTGVGGSTNLSGYTLDPSLVQIWWTDIEWLGVGDVRVGFIIDGKFITCHTFHHANTPSTPNSDNTTTYMTTATLPVRYEITNTGDTPPLGTSTMRQICSTVISEGGYNNVGTTWTAGTGTNLYRLTTQDIYYPIVSIRLAPNRLDSIVVPRQVDLLSTTVNYYRWVLLSNATLTGDTWAQTSQTGTVQIDKAATIVTGGTEIQSGFASSRELAQLAGSDLFQYQLGRTLAGVSDTLTLAVASTSNNADILAQVGWQELT